jgi:type III pantothenate kinase
VHFGIVDIGNSGLKVGMSDRNRRLISQSVRSLYWIYPGDERKPPPKEWLANPSTMRTRMDDVESIAGALSESSKAARMLSDRGESGASQLDCVTWLVGSVQPQATETLRRAVAEFLPNDKVRVIRYSDIDLKIQVDAPERVGLDRLLAASEAWRLGNQSSPMIVVQAGTAITVDWLDEQGTYCGGAILPGISLTLKYLALGTAQLPWLAPPADPCTAKVPGKNTNEAILAGVTAGAIGGLSKLIDDYQVDYDGDPRSIQVIVSGGDGAWLSKAMKVPHRLVEHLVLQSLTRMAGTSDESA